MIDIANENLFSLNEAVRQIPGRPHISTIHRWRMRKDSPLETVKIGGRVFTSQEAIERFICSCTDPTTKTRTSKTRQRAIDKADRELAAEGI